MSLLIEGQANMCLNSYLPAFSLGTQYDRLGRKDSKFDLHEHFQLHITFAYNFFYKRDRPNFFSSISEMNENVTNMENRSRNMALCLCIPLYQPFKKRIPI